MKKFPILSKIKSLNDRITPIPVLVLNPVSSTDLTTYNLTNSLENKSFVFMSCGTWGNINATAFMTIGEFKRANSSSQYVELTTNVAYQTSKQAVKVNYSSDTAIQISCENASQLQFRMWAM